MTGDHSASRLLLGECLDLMRSLPEGSIDLVLCDLPYGTTACSWDSPIPLDALWSAYRRVCKPNAAIVLTATQPFTSVLVTSNLASFKHEWIWHKSKSGSAFTAKYRPLAKHESVLVFGRGKITYNPQMTLGATPYRRQRGTDAINNHRLGLGTNPSETINDGSRYPISVQFFQQKWRRQDQVHPTQKPVALMSYMIETYSNPGDTVLDNCMGSGTSGIAAAETGRRFVGIEQDAGYYAIAERRITDALIGLDT